MLIIFSGLPGSGKTSIARELAKELRATYLRIDTIEQAIRRYDNADINVGPMGYFVASDTARDNLAFGLTVIIDSVNPMKLTRDWYRDVALTAGVPYLEIEVVCSDVQEHRARVETRIGDIEGLPLPNWAAVINHDYEPWDRERLVLDSVKLTVSESVAAVLASVGSEAQPY